MSVLPTCFYVPLYFSPFLVSTFHQPIITWWMGPPKLSGPAQKLVVDSGQTGSEVQLIYCQWRRPLGPICFHSCQSGKDWHTCGCAVQIWPSFRTLAGTLRSLAGRGYRSTVYGNAVLTFLYASEAKNCSILANATDRLLGYWRWRCGEHCLLEQDVVRIRRTPTQQAGRRPTSRDLPAGWLQLHYSRP